MIRLRSTVKRTQRHSLQRCSCWRVAKPLQMLIIKNNIRNSSQVQTRMRNNLQSFNCLYCQIMLFLYPILADLPRSIFIDNHCIDEALLSRKLLEANLIIRIDSHYSKSRLINCITGSIIVDVGHLRHEICLTSAHSFHNRHQVPLVVAVRRLDFLEAAVREVRVDAFVNVGVGSQVKRRTVIYHCVVERVQIGQDSLAHRALARTSHWIMRHRDDEQSCLRCDLELRGEGFQRRSVSRSGVSYLVRIEGKEVSVSELEPCGEVQAEIVQLKCRVQQQPIVVGIVLVIARDKYAWNLTYKLLSHAQKFNVSVAIVAVQVVADISQDHHQFKLLFNHLLPQRLGNGSKSRSFYDTPICKRKDVYLRFVGDRVDNIALNPVLKARQGVWGRV